MMNTQQRLKLVNPLLILSAAIQILTGIAFLFHIDSELVEELHEFNGIALAILVLAHLWLNWGWVKTNLLAGKK